MFEVSIRLHWNFIPGPPIGTPKVGIPLHLCIFESRAPFFSHSERRYRNLWIRDWIVERSRPADEVCTSSEKELHLLLGLQSAQGTPTTFHFEACRCCWKGLLIVSAGWILAANAIANSPEARSTVRFGIGTTNRKLIHLFFLWFFRQGANFIRLADSFGGTISQGWIIWTVHRHGDFWNWTVGTRIAESRVENVICGVKTPGWQI